MRLLLYIVGMRMEKAFIITRIKTSSMVDCNIRYWRKK